MGYFDLLMSIISDKKLEFEVASFRFDTDETSKFADSLASYIEANSITYGNSYSESINLQE